MGFKSDREFLRNITIGAVGTRQVARLLNQGGFRIIELERCATSNKIWATKIKRLRVPDLLCIRSGIRIESRAKSTLKVTMSHAVNNPLRGWDAGLRDDDLVAFIHCTPTGETAWLPSDEIRLFRVKDMRATADAAGLSQMKAASEGSEIQLTWPATIPGRAGQVLAVTEDAVEVLQDSGRRQRYKLVAKRGKGADVKQYSLRAYVRSGQRVEAGDAIIASVVPEAVPLEVPSGEHYNFLADLDAPERETVYAAAKALGHLPELRERCADRLQHVLTNHDDALVQLEAAGALARLENDTGWGYLQRILDSDSDQAIRMEAVLILTELKSDRSLGFLSGVARNRANDAELRAAAAWGMGEAGYPIGATSLLDLLADEDETTAVHALVAVSRLISEDSMHAALRQLGDEARRSAGIVQAIILSGRDPVERVVGLLRSTSGSQRRWLMYLLARLGRDHCEERLSRAAPELLEEFEFFWRYHDENWTTRLDVADQLDFQRAQLLD